MIELSELVELPVAELTGTDSSSFRLFTYKIIYARGRQFYARHIYGAGRLSQEKFSP